MSVLNVVAEKGDRASRHHQSSTPSAWMSLRPSMSFCDATCSGLMNRGEPRRAPVCVRPSDSSVAPSAGSSLLMPKSSSLGITAPESSRCRKTFAGLRSR